MGSTSDGCCPVTANRTADTLYSTTIAAAGSSSRTLIHRTGTRANRLPTEVTSRVTEASPNANADDMNAATWSRNRSLNCAPKT
jgi:hypothetical protein